MIFLVRFNRCVHGNIFIRIVQDKNKKDPIASLAQTEKWAVMKSEFEYDGI